MKLRAVLRINEIRRNVTKNSMQLFQNLSSRLLNILNIFDCHFTSFILHKFSCWKIVCSVRYLFLRKRSGETIFERRLNAKKQSNREFIGICGSEMGTETDISDFYPF